MSFRIEAIVATSLLGVLRSLRSVYVSLPIRSATFSVAEIKNKFQITFQYRIHIYINNVKTLIRSYNNVTYNSGPRLFIAWVREYLETKLHISLTKNLYTVLCIKLPTFAV